MAEGADEDAALKGVFQHPARTALPVDLTCLPRSSATPESHAPDDQSDFEGDAENGVEGRTESDDPPQVSSRYGVDDESSHSEEE
jgi:hypothetical protein